MNLNLSNSSQLLTSLGISVLSASTLSILFSKECPFVCENTNNNTNTTNNNVVCPVSYLTRTGLVLGVLTVGAGSTLNCVNLLR